ncbi:MAG: 4Fe-4S binding protein [Candidatus Alcyoniella australis]|nr:4Fe-4S binding protein [Candidatus Alcyoniella australis]
MYKRPIIVIDQDKCTGCGLCVTACAEGALAIVDGKAKVVNEIFCDGLGACIGDCPEGALTIEEREAPQFDPQAVESNQRKPAAASHFNCPGSQVKQRNLQTQHPDESGGRICSRLSQWPVQLRLLPPDAVFFNNADLLVTADCVPFAYAEYHRDFLDGAAVAVGCPKLDDLAAYEEKLERIFISNRVRSVTVLQMEVPCCSGLAHAVRTALDRAGSDLPLRVVTVGLDGTLLEDSVVPASTPAERSCCG